MKERIFISYKRVDKDRVFKLKDLIEYETKEKCWIDIDGIESDDQFGLVIANAIEKADIFLFMYSRAHSEIFDYENDWTIREINYAQAEKKRIVFVNIDGTPLTKWFKLIFGLKQQVDVTSGTAVKKLIQDLKKWLAESSQENDIDTSVKEVTSLETETAQYDDDFETAEVLFDAKEYNDAILYYLESAKKGNKTAQNKLCQFFYDSRQFVEDISDEVWQKVEELAANGECYAYFLMNCKYYFDPLNKELAFEYAKKATLDKTLPLAFLRLGAHYCWAVGTKQHSILAMHNYLKAFNLGCKEACNFIGNEYRVGSSKMQKDINKAVEYYKKGADLHDKGSMRSLANTYYYDLKKSDEAKEVAQQMIQCGFFYGYVLMGDFCSTNPDYTYNYDHIEEGKKWYRKALLHDEYEAYSSLARIYWDIDDNHKEAYSLVQQGYHKHDSFSITMLALFSCIDEDFEKAWLYAKEGFDRYSKTNLIGSIFFDYNYRKDNDEDEKQLEEDLENILEFGAHNGNSEDLKYLLRLHAFQESGEDNYDFERFKIFPKIQEDIKLGAEMNMPELMFFYGRLLLDNNYREFNPAKGVSYIIRSATDGYNDALPFLLDYRKTGTYNDDIDYDKIATIAIKQKFIGDDYVAELLRYGENNEELSQDFVNYIRTILEANRGKIKLFVLALNVLFNKNKKGELLLESEEINQYKHVIEKERSRRNLGYISSLKSHLSLLYPEYNEEKIYHNYEATDEIEQQLFYAANYANDKEIDISLQDDFLERLHSLLKFDISLLQDNSNYNADINEVMQAMVNYHTSYIAVCKKRGIPPLDYNLPKAEYLFPYMPTSVCAKISFDTFNLFLTLRDTFPEIYEPMLPILKNDEQMLNYIETLGSDQDLQLFLIELIEIKIDIESVMLNNFALYKSYKENNKKLIVEYLNSCIEKFGEKINGNVALYTEETLPDISQIVPNRTIDLNDAYEQSKESITSKELNDSMPKDDDEFERLLNEFINSNVNNEKDD